MFCDFNISVLLLVLVNEMKYADSRIWSHFKEDHPFAYVHVLTSNTIYSFKAPPPCPGTHCVAHAVVSAHSPLGDGSLWLQPKQSQDTEEREDHPAGLGAAAGKNDSSSFLLVA